METRTACLNILLLTDQDPAVDPHLFLKYTPEFAGMIIAHGVFCIITK